MRVFRINRICAVCAVILICLLTLYALLHMAGSILRGEPIGVTARVCQCEDAQVRSRLLMDAMHQVGTCNPMDTVKLWASGLKNRSAALQYAALDAGLKEEYARQLETGAPNWVTGLSSPWVEGYEILEINSPEKSVCMVHMLFFTATSTGPYEDYKAELRLLREGMFWRITHITAEDGLYPYTRLKL